MKPDQLGLSVGIGVLLVAVFLLDVHMALGFTPWLLYVIPLALTYWIVQLYAPLVVAALCTLLVFFGYDQSPPLVPESVALINRTIGTVTFWTLAFLIVNYKLLAQRLSRLTHQLRLELMERTEDLGRAVSALRKETEQRSRPEREQPETGDEFTRQVTDVLMAESRRLQEQVAHLEKRAPTMRGVEVRLEHTRSELERLGKQLEQLQHDLLHP